MSHPKTTWGLKPPLKAGKDVAAWKNPKLVVMCLMLLNTQLAFYRVIAPVKISTNDPSKVVLSFLECAL